MVDDAATLTMITKLDDAALDPLLNHSYPYVKLGIPSSQDERSSKGNIFDGVHPEQSRGAHDAAGMRRGFHLMLYS
jgi:hypothetical protein